MIKLLKIDLHVHTSYSDGDIIDRIIYMALKKRLDGIAITDHYTLKGFLNARKYSRKLLILPGMEVKTRIGHILLLGLDINIRKIPLRFEDLIDFSRDNNIITILAHPFTHIDKIRRHLNEIRGLNAIETYNSLYPLFPIAVKISQNLSKYLNLPSTGGSDAHTYTQIGNCYTIFSTDNEIYEAIRNGSIRAAGKPSNIYSRIKLTVDYLHTHFI